MEAYLALASKVPIILLITIAALTTIGGDYLGKLWSVNLQPWAFWAGFALYALTTFFYFPTLLREGLIVTSILWTVLATVGFLIIGYFVFGENLSTTQWIGVGLGVLAVGILSF